MLVLTLVALGLRLYWLDKGLPYMHGDEGEMGQLARLALFGPGPGRGELPLPFFRTGFLDHPTLFHYIQGWFLLWFGNTEYSLKLLSAVAGALCAPVLYAAGRVGWGWMAGLAAGWLVAVSHLHIHFSRLALNNIESVLFAAGFVLLALLAYAAGKLPPSAGKGGSLPALMHPGGVDPPGSEDQEHPPPAVPSRNAAPPAQRVGRLSLFVAMGLIMGLSQYFYYGSRLIPVVALPVLVLLWANRRMRLVHWLGVGMAIFVSYWPLFAFYLDELGVISQPCRRRQHLAPGRHDSCPWPRGGVARRISQPCCSTRRKMSWAFSCGTATVRPSMPPRCLRLTR